MRIEIRLARRGQTVAVGPVRQQAAGFIARQHGVLLH
jgi:hypothetical protein